MNGTQDLRKLRRRVGKTGGVEPPAKWKPGEKALLEIRKHQKDVGFLIPKRPFWRLVREISSNISTDKLPMRWQASAVEALRVVVEDHVALTLNSKL